MSLENLEERLQQEIAERKRIERLLRETQIRHQALIEHLPVITYIAEFGIEGTWIFVSPQIEKILGYSTSEWINTIGIWTDRLDPRDRDRVLKEEAISHETGNPFQCEYRMLARDGRVVWVHDEAVVIKDDEGNPLFLQGIISDICKRKEMEEALREHQKWFETLSQLSPVGIFRTDAEGNCLYVNNRWCEIAGLSSEEAAGKGWIQALHPEDRDRIFKEWSQAIKEKRPFQDEYRFRRPDGRITSLIGQSVSVLDDAGQIIGYIGTITDVTDLKHLQEQLLQSQKIETVGRLAGGIAHDFNNLLMAISGYCELIGIKYQSDPVLLQHVTEIEKAADHGASLTHQLLAFSRKQVLASKALNLNQLILKLETMISRLIGERIVLKVDLEPNLATIMADPGQIEQMIMNLVVNAHDAMPEGGTLMIRTANSELTADSAKQFPSLKPGQFVLLSITDTGAGMDEETKSRIFEPFFTTKGVGKGTGLGLATVYGIIRQSGGDVTVLSQPGKGTSFTFYLPSVAGAKCAPDLSEERASFVHSGSECILLVDDNDNVRSAIAQSLDMYGYTVLQACNGDEALKNSREYSGAIDVLVTDVVMPTIGGLELGRRLKLERPQIKILYMSGYSNEGNFCDGNLEAAYLQKPASILAVLQNIRKLVDVEP